MKMERRAEGRSSIHKGPTIISNLSRRITRAQKPQTQYRQTASLVAVRRNEVQHVMRIKSILSFCFLFFSALVAAEVNKSCDLPQELQSEIAARYPDAKLVTLAALDEDDRGFFQKDHGDSCPGLTKVDFYGDGKPALALVLMTETEGKQKAKLVLAHKVAGQWTTKTLDTSDLSPVPVVWSEPAGKYRGVDGKKEIRATKPVIVFAGYEAWEIVYAWTGNRVEKIWRRD